MKKRSLLTAALLLTAGTALTPGAPAGAGPSAGGLSTDNVEFIRHIPISNDGVGGRLIGRYFYTNDQNKIMIFDTKTPEDPQLVSVVPMPQEAIYSREDLDGNGKILIVPNTVSGVSDGTPPSDAGGGTGSGGVGAANALYIIDVEDKTNPRIISKINGAAQHTFSCILDCKYAYGSDGNIVDLRNPAEPQWLEAKWTEATPAQGGGHDVEEIAPGFVLTSTQPIMLLDVRKSVTRPKVLALGASEDGRFIHSGRWPQKGKDNFLLMGGETNNRVRCSEQTGALMTWDASNWKKTHTFSMIDEYRMKNGTYADGSPPANVMGCSSHWLEASPKFKNGGVMAAAFFEHGIRFIDVSSKGKINEIGWYIGHGTSAGAVYWVNDEILYAIDYTRGIDVLRFTGDQ